MLEIFKRLWVGWNGMARHILLAQNALLMGFTYVVALGPVALWFRLSGKQLVDRGPADPKAETYWQPRSGKPMTMDEATRQF